MKWKNSENKKAVKWQGEPVVTSFIPKSFDWRLSGQLPDTRNQGQCGSCWSFAITRSLEISEVLFGFRDAQNLSEQEMVSCESSAYGCGGGFMESAEYVVKKGLGLESDFPYQAANVRCKKVPSKAKAVEFVLLGDENTAPKVDAIKSAILRYGSVFVTVAAGGNGWSSSGKEVTGCKNRGTNHMVNIVGWTEDNKWVMSNSWGKDWKDGGYALVPFGCDKIAEEAGYIEVEQ